LWTVLTDGDKPKLEEANNVYNSPSTKETIRYLHASAGHPVEDTWTKAIKAGNFTTWPGLSVKLYTNTSQNQMKPYKAT
jgi:hypothetical protein